MRQPYNLPAFCRVHRNGRPLIGMSACLQSFRGRSHRADLLSLHEPGRRDERAWAVLDDIGRSLVSSGRLGLQPG
jgi:hypothetical protein